MLNWRQKTQKQYSLGHVTLEGFMLVYCRTSGVLTQLDLRDLQRVSLLTIKGQVHWHLQTLDGEEALLAESLPGMGRLRRALAEQSEFDYHALCQFDPEQECQADIWHLRTHAQAAKPLAA